MLNFGEAAIRREGTDVTIVGILRMAHIAEQAAKTLASEHGVEAEVIDPRTLRPLDLDTILESVRKTNRLRDRRGGLAPRRGRRQPRRAGPAEQAFDHLDAPIQRVTGADVPMPYSKRLEQSAIPHAEHVVSAALATTRGGADLMATDIVMPRLSDSMEEGTVLKWMKSVGDEVALGEELVEIETDKANMVFESDAAGTLDRDRRRRGRHAADRRGDRAGRRGGRGAERQRRLGGGDEAEGRAGGQRRRAAKRGPRPRHAAGERPAPTAARRPGRALTDGRAGQGFARSPGGSRRRRASIWARCRARGPAGGSSRPTSRAPQAGGAAPAAAAAAPAHGRRGGDPPRAQEKPETAKGEVEVVELTKLQQTVSRRMAESKATAPHFYLQAEIDMTAACRGARGGSRRRPREGEAVPSFNDMVVKACAIALREFPRANGAYRDGKWELYSRVNVGDRGRRAATRSWCRRSSTPTARACARSRASRARWRRGCASGTITPPELSGGTFTVSNLGMYGISNFHAVINPPQAAILAVGAITETPVVRATARSPARG